MVLAIADTKEDVGRRASLRREQVKSNQRWLRVRDRGDTGAGWGVRGHVTGGAGVHACEHVRLAAASVSQFTYRTLQKNWSGLKRVPRQMSVLRRHEDRRQRCKKWGLREIKLKTGKQHHRGGGGGRVRTTCGTTHRHSCKHPALLTVDVPGVNPDWEHRNLGRHSLINSSQKYAESTEKMCAHFRGEKKVDNYCNNRTNMSSSRNCRGQR